MMRNRWRYAEVYPESSTYAHWNGESGRAPLELTNNMDVTVQVKYRPELPWQERFVGLDLWLLSPYPVARWRRVVSRMIRPIARAAVKKWRL